MWGVSRIGSPKALNWASLRHAREEGGSGLQRLGPRMWGSGLRPSGFKGFGRQVYEFLSLYFDLFFFLFL